MAKILLLNFFLLILTKESPAALDDLETFCFEKWRPVPESKSKMGIYKKAAVASDGGPCSVQGAEVMKDEGGSVVDAAIVTLLCNGLVNLHSMGIGGGFFMTIYNRTTKETHVVDARETAPLGASKTMYDGNYEGSLVGPLASGVPGEIQGYWRAHERFGRLPWRSLFRRVISMATNGWPLSQSAAHALESKVKANETQLESLRPLLYDAKRGRWKRAGETLKNEKLAFTLEKIAKYGAKEFYQGGLAADISQEFIDHGGIITKEDLRHARNASYFLQRKPLVYELRNGWKILGPPPPASAVVVSFILNIIESFYPHFSGRKVLKYRKPTLKMLHRYTEAMKFAYAKRTFLGDESFIDVADLVANLTSHEYGDEIAKKVTGKTHDKKYYGPASFFENHGTSHNSLLSPEGDAVAITSTINAYFGSKFLGPKTGILYNNEMNDFSIPGHVDDYGIPPSPYNWIEPGKKPMSSMSPVVVVDRAGRVRMVVGGSGGSKISTAVASVIRNHLWFGQNIKDAIDMSRVHHQLVPEYIEAEKWFPKGLLTCTKTFALGSNTTINARRMAIVQGITVDNWGIVRANSDFRKGGYPAGF